ncbi:hypothetical protein CXB51_006990 [Gossypium anomalum]|uniref:SAND domain-containing protein n=2 Tax=Gossypium TaxID=3633 RepID=A0A8J6DBG2_9ROSI|nr:hypothetical protein CXB51_006990 [Gossypium anomalum]
MENEVERESGSMIFSDEELIEVSGLKKGRDFIEVTCGCTSHRYGDAVGKLRVFSNGDLEITCECTPGCNEGLSVSISISRFSPFSFRPYFLLSPSLFLFSFDVVFDLVFSVSGFSKLQFCFLSLDRVKLIEKTYVTIWILHKLTPAAFEKHSGRETARKWKNNVWVIVNGEKVSLSKTALLKYYNQASKNANGTNRSHNGRVCHRDEFVRCSRCNKERRFRLRTKEECRIHHDALADVNWKCSDLPYDRITCDDEEERASRRVYRGCTRSPTCKGCTSCVCFGCEICRFTDCSCQTCIDFTRNAKA